MDIIKEIQSKRLERKLDNGLIEIKEFWDSGKLLFHFFLNKNGKLHGEWKEYNENGQLKEHELYKDSKLIKDYLK